MRRSAYLETTVIGYLAMRSSRDVRVAANQLSTREWWDDHRPEFDIFVSQFVIDECEQGDPSAASERRIYLNDIPVLDMNDNVETLAEEIANELQIPPKARIDAFHISHFHGGCSWDTISFDVELQAYCESREPSKNRACLS